MRRAAAALVAVLCIARPAAGDDLAPEAPRTAIVAGASLALVGVAELARDRLVPPTCRWCDPPALDRHARDAFLWSDPHAASVLSDVAVVALPVALAGADLAARGDARRAGEDALVAVESIALAEVGTEVVKFSVVRRRPGAVAAGARQSADDDLSFFSGHTSGAFAAAAAFGTVARLRGDRAAWAVYAAGFTAAAGVGYLRVAADKHWLTDVAAGAAFGTAVGVAVPLVLHRRSAPGPSVSVGPRSVVLQLAF
jgi:membrane-associated phospholipid phosphatase